jgi:hypothetical protein
MRDHLVQLAGSLALVVSAIHGILGETKVFTRVRIDPPQLRSLLRLVWHCGTCAWVSLGILLIATPGMASEEARHWIIAMSVFTFGFAAVANAWATRGRHFGWGALVVVVGLALGGL